MQLQPTKIGVRRPSRLGGGGGGGNQPAPSSGPSSLQQRRKWSDWSECSASCVKTRHRLNCDDILVTANATTSTSTTKQQISNDNESNQNKKNFPPPIEGSIGKRDSAGQDELLAEDSGDDPDLQLRAGFASDQNDEDDYADEPEQDEEDSCANVDTSKTFEELPCFGGACNPNLAHREQNQQPPLRQQQQQQIQRQKFNLPEKPPKRAIWPQPQANHQSAVRRPPDNTRQDLLAPQELLEPALGQRGQLAPLPALPQDNQRSAGYANLTKTIQQQQQATPKTGTIWPQLLWPSQSGGRNEQTWQTLPTGHLIQWTILIGVGATMLLAVMFILRKLFSLSTGASHDGDNHGKTAKQKLPSYQWLLARQTAGAGDKGARRRRRLLGSAGPADCCNGARTRSSSSSLGCCGAPVDPTALGQYHSHHHQPLHHPPPHASYLAWNGRNHLVSFDRDLLKGHQQQQQQNLKQQMVAYSSEQQSPNGHLVNSLLLAGQAARLNGGGGGGQFNTDYAPLSDDLPPYANPASLFSSPNSTYSLESRRQQNRSLQHEHPPVDYNYDTVASATRHQHHRQDRVADHSPGGPMGGASQDASCSTTISGGGRQLASAPGRSSSSERRRASVIRDAHQLDGGPREPKHGSPNVPRAVTMTSSAATDEVMDQQQQNHAPTTTKGSSNSTGSRSSSIVSAASSSSVQSTTAPMLSNAASFEQASDFELQQQPHTVASQSLNSSPASHCQATRPSARQKNKALTTHQSVQSQPNSPMFANQFAGASKRHRRMASANFRPPKPDAGTGQCRPSHTDDAPASRGVAHPGKPSWRDSRDEASARGQTTGVDLPDTRYEADKAAAPGRPDSDNEDQDDDDDRHFYEEISAVGGF